MIDERTLEALLGEVADGVELPDDGLEAALAAIRTGDGRRDGARRWLPSARPGLPAVAAGLVLVVLAVSAALVIGHRAASPPRSSAAAAASAGNVAGSGNALDKGRYAPQSAAAGPEAGSGGTAGGSSSSGSSGTTGSAPGSAPGVAPITAPMVVRTATVQLRVAANATDRTLTRLGALATGAGGYVQDSSSETAGAVPAGSVTLRIPSAAYTRVRDALTAGGYGHVTSLEERGTDVTAQYVDLGARLDALTKTRASYLALLGRAGSIPDVLAVQQQLSSVQQQIESLQGQRNVLADTSADATITVAVSGPAAPAPPRPHHRSGWATAFSRAGHGLVHDLQAVVARTGGALVVLLGVALLAAVSLVAARLVRRRLI